MTNQDFVCIKLPLPLLNALHKRMTATRQTETEVLLAALSAYLTVETKNVEIKAEISSNLETASIQQELTNLRQDMAAVQQRLAIAEQMLNLVSAKIQSEAQPMPDPKPVPTVHITADEEDCLKPLHTIAPLKQALFEDIEDDEPDEILYGFLDPEDR